MYFSGPGRGLKKSEKFCLPSNPLTEALASWRARVRSQQVWLESGFLPAFHCSAAEVFLRKKGGGVMDEKREKTQEGRADAHAG